MSLVATAVFAALRRMDAEASVPARGSPTGLNWYGGHFRPDLKRPQTEPCWTRRLGQLLPEAGFPTRCEVPYPAAPNRRCDNVLTLHDGGALWLENKGAWKQWWRRRGGEWIYRSYLLHPLVEGLDAKTHTVPHDLAKLDRLRPADATAAAFLLVGLDHESAPMDADVELLVEKAGLARPPWSASEDRWPDPYRTGERVRCWMWDRRVT